MSDCEHFAALNLCGEMRSCHRATAPGARLLHASHAAQKPQPEHVDASGRDSCARVTRIVRMEPEDAISRAADGLLLSVSSSAYPTATQRGRRRERDSAG